MLEARRKIDIQMVCDLVDGYLLAIFFLNGKEWLLEICQIECQFCKATHLWENGWVCETEIDDNHDTKPNTREQLVCMIDHNLRFW